MTITTTNGQVEPVNNFFLNNLQKFASDMQIAFELEKAVAGNQHPIAIGIKVAIKDNLPLDIIISNIKAMATTNFNAIADHIGVSLTEKIMQL